MKHYRMLFLLFFAAVVTVQPLLSHIQEKHFRLMANPTLGPHRLSVGWTDRSLMSCVTSCITRYTTNCHSVMYNHLTKLCTPGKKLNYSENVPSSDEGHLYTMTVQRDSGFQLHFSNKTTACLFTYNIKLNYTEAHAMCQTMDAHLVTIKSVDKLALVQSLDRDNTLWVGLDDLEEENKFLWVDDGTELDASLKSQIFDEHEPNNSKGKEDCVCLPRHDNSRLNDVNCGQRHHFLCEKDIS